MSESGAATRQDGPLKTTGAARYLDDLRIEGALEGVLVTAPTGPGTVTVDVAAARSAPGVVTVFGPGDLALAGGLDHWALGQNNLPLADDRVRYAGQPVALVVAASRAQAARAADAVVVSVAAEPARADFQRLLAEGTEIEDWAPTRSLVGDPDAGEAEADVIVTGRYTTADRHHVPLEPPGAVARWDGDRLEVWTSTQWVFGVRGALAQALAIEPDRITVRAGFVGGGFGSKGSTWPHEILAAAAARRLERPVRLVLPRVQTFAAAGHQPRTAQEVSLAARRDGTLTALRHTSWSAAAMDEDYVEHGSLGSRTMYACPSIATRDLIVRLDRPQPTFMRAPHEGPGMPALEIAMDELAEALGLDPLELRLRNYAEQDPTSGKPFSSKALRECYRIGAERFGWSRRRAVPGTWREGDELVGVGMASALMATFRFGATAKVTVGRDGGIVVEAAAHEIGNGAGTVLAQIAAESLGAPVERVRVVLGETTLPEAGGTFGSGTTLSVGSAVHAAAEQLRERLSDLAGEPGLTAAEYPELLALRRLDQVSETATWAPRREDAAWAMNAYGAVFVEVGVDPLVPVPRVRRVVGVYSCGRILNPALARSQLIGGITWGIGQALLEESRTDPVDGRFLAPGLGGYSIPGQSDVPDIDASFVAEHDERASRIGARGVGEIGTIGIGGAIANAVFNATGVRVRDLPIRPEHLLGRIDGRAAVR
ncbi:MAG: xanthine dehydrogenase family protein molybdopterin-binding subunit [Gemmatimonadales bacterium]